MLPTEREVKKPCHLGSKGKKFSVERRGRRLRSHVRWPDHRDGPATR